MIVCVSTRVCVRARERGERERSVKYCMLMIVCVSTRVCVRARERERGERER
jgi:hypothetical protein